MKYMTDIRGNKDCCECEGAWNNISTLEDYSEDEERYECEDCGSVWLIKIRIERDFGDSEKIIKELS